MTEKERDERIQGGEEQEREERIRQYKAAFREFIKELDAEINDALEKSIELVSRPLCSKAALRKQLGLKRKKSGGRKRSHDLSLLLDHYDTLEAEFQAAKDWVRSRWLPITANKREA